MEFDDFNFSNLNYEEFNDYTTIYESLCDNISPMDLISKDTSIETSFDDSNTVDSDTDFVDISDIEGNCFTDITHYEPYRKTKDLIKNMSREITGYKDVDPLSESVQTSYAHPFKFISKDDKDILAKEIYKITKGNNKRFSYEEFEEEGFTEHFQFPGF